jgi:hypothetical protein
MGHGSEIRLNPLDIVRIGNSTLPWQSYFPPTSGGGGGVPPPPPPDTKPSSFLAWSILATIFCCLPFGIVSIVYAAKVDSLWYARDYIGAKRAARQARTWFWWAFGVGLMLSIFYFIYWIVVGVAIGSDMFY